MAGPASDYHRGEMDIHAQQATFHLVMVMTKWSSLAVAAGVLFLALWFCTAAGFGAAFFSALVLIVIGVIGLRDRKAASH